MAYSGFVSDPEYTRRSQAENVTGKWNFENEITFNKVIRGTGLATYYGDLAEYYEYNIIEHIPVGSLVKFGGLKQITKTNCKNNDYFGVVSSNPGVILNTQSDSSLFLPVALCGRVPCRVSGKVTKFDKLTLSKIPGVAKKKTFLDTILLKPTIGISLENKLDNKEKLIEIFVRANI